MPASKRRRAAAARRLSSGAAVAEAAPAASSAEVIEKPAAPARRRPAAVRAPRTVRRPLGGNLDDEPRWGSRGLLVLLVLAFVVQVPVGALIHATSHGNLLIIDMFFLQPQYVLLACFLVMPIARILTHQPRSLRLLESLSLGAVYALLALLVTTTFVHPSSSSTSTDAFLNHLQVSDGIRLAAGDVLAIAGTVALFPGINRLLSAPGRRARARAAQRATAPSSGGTSPRGKPATGAKRRD